jgi:hypothetical protein
VDGSETPAPGYVTKTENGSECIKFCNWTLYAFFEDRYGNRLLSIRKHHIKSHAPRGFCSERRDFSLCLGNRGLARRCTWVPPRGWAGGLSRSAIKPAEASAATARISTLREARRSHRPRRNWRSKRQFPLALFKWGYYVVSFGSPPKRQHWRRLDFRNLLNNFHS